MLQRMKSSMQSMLMVAIETLLRIICCVVMEIMICVANVL